MSIRRKLWLSVTALLALVLLGNGFIIMSIERGELRRSLVRESRTFIFLAGPQILRAFGESEMLATGDDVLKEKLEEIAKGLPSLISFAVFSERGRLLVSYPDGTKQEKVDLEAVGSAGADGVERSVVAGGGEAVELTIPIRVRFGSPSVIMQVTVSEREVDERLNSLMSVYGASLLILLILGALLALKIADAILGPLGPLKEATLKIKDGDLSARVKEGGPGEIGDLSHTFNMMAGELEEHRHELEERNAALEKAYGELQAMQEELVSLERMAAVGRTASAVSHEIDNPIGVILGTAQMLKEELASSEDLLGDVTLIEDECKRVRRIVRDLLDLARPGSTHCVELNLKELVELVLRGISHHPQFKKIAFEVHWAETMPKVAADPDGIKQVLLNLLINASNAMGGEGTVALRSDFDENCVRLHVDDSGPGIGEEYLERIFKPFFTTDSEKGGGTGLGLSVSRRIVEEEGGSLFARNVEGGGARFTIELPIECLS